LNERWGLAEQPVDPQTAATVFRILRDRLSDDPKGRDILAQFEQDPEDGAEGLADYLRRRLEADDAFVQALAEAPELPTDLRTVVYGGQVERIIHIAQAGTVIVSPPARRGLRLWVSLAALAIVAVGLILGALSFGGDRQPGTPTPFPPPQVEPISALEGMAVSAIAQNPQNGDLWVSVLTDKTPGGVYRYTRGEGLTFFGQEGEKPRADVQAILGRANGEVWFATRGEGVTALLAGAGTPSTDDDRWQTYTVADGLIGSKLLAMAEDWQGNIWFGTFDGLCRLTPGGEWLYYHPETGWTGDRQALPEDPPVAHAIRVDGMGDVWVGTSEALLRWPADDLERGQPIRYSREDALSNEDRIGPGCLVSLAFDNEGRLWVCTAAGFVSVLTAGVETHDERDDRWQTYAIAPEVDTAIVLALLPLPDSRVLAGTTGGGLRIYDPGLDLWAGHTDFGLNVMALFLEEEEERVWIGTSQGLFLWDLRSIP
jgi:ligand-binding sensor domain-containing protein